MGATKVTPYWQAKMLSDALIGWNRTGGKIIFAFDSQFYLVLADFWSVLGGFFQTKLCLILGSIGRTGQFGLVFKTMVETDQIFFWLKYAFFF